MKKGTNSKYFLKNERKMENRMNFNHIEVRPMCIEDLKDIMIVERLCFSIPWSESAFIEEITKNKFAIYFSAHINGKAVGYCGMWKVCDEGHITNVAVHPEYRKNGIGSLLVEALISKAREVNVERMTLEVRKNNIWAQLLYKKYGFQVEGIRKGYYADNGEDALIMWANV